MNAPSFGFPSPGHVPAGPQAPAAPSFGQPPAPGGFAQPSAAPVAPEPTFWAYVNGAPVSITLTQARTLPPATPLMSADQSSGWKQAHEILPAAAPAPAPFQAPPQQAFQPQQPAAPAPFQPQQSFQPQQPGAFQAPPQQAAPGVFQPQQPAPFQAPQQQRSAYPPPANTAAAAPHGLFSGAANASASRSGANLNDGDYVARYIGAEFKQGQGNNAMKQWVIHEVEIIKSSYDPANPASLQCTQVGQRVSIFVTKNVSFDGNMKEIALALMPLDANGQRRPDNAYISEQEFGAMLQDPCPLAGRMIYLEARKKKTKPTPQKPEGGEFTHIAWWHMPADAQGNPDLPTFLAHWR
jgi:hypothetical protein